MPKINNKRVDYVVNKSGCYNLIYDIYNIYQMIADQLPQQITYSKVIPKGYPSIYKQWINDPLTGNKTWANNDIVRFNFMNSRRGTFDPLRSFLQITVSVDINEMPIGLLQIDNSAHSFINQLVIYSNNRQVERITQYGVLLAYLNDIGMNQFLSEGRQTQGLGYGSFDTTPFNKGMSMGISQPRRMATGSDLSSTYGITNIFPTIGNCYPEQVQYLNQNSIYNCSRSVKGHYSNSNVITTGSDWNGGNTMANATGIAASMKFSGYAQNIRTDYLTPFISNKYPESTQSIPNYQLIVQPQVGNNQYPFKYTNTKQYLVDVRNTLTDTLYYDNTHYSNTHYISSSNFGFNSMFAPSFTKGTFQPFISPTVPQSMIANGKFTRTKFPILRRKFKIPVASAVMGCLMNSQTYCLLPLQSINDVLMQITLDPYAMFTSGYSDFCELDDIGMNVQQKRCYNIERIQYKLHTYFFVDAEIENYIKTSLYQQIIIVNNFWSLGNQYQIAANTLVNNSYIIGCSSNHLNQLVCLFVANDYQHYSFCRKHFRLSNCIKRYWSKLAVDYWPPQPFKGNGGNPVSNNIDDDNSIFLQNIYWANNYMFSKNTQPRINIYNFAINDRPYDPTNKNTFYDPAMYNNYNYAFKSNSVNADTALGMPYIHQNRVIGKAAYIITYTPFLPSQGLLQGIDVSGLSNFQIVFENDSGSTFSRDQTLYIYCKSSVIVKYSNEGIKTQGR